MPNLLFIALQGATLGLLPGQAELMKQPTDVIRVITDTEALGDQVGHAARGPQVPREAVGLGAPLQHLGQLSEPLPAELGLGPGMRARDDACFASLGKGVMPLADGLTADLEVAGYLGLRPALLEQQDRLPAALLAGGETTNRLSLECMVRLNHASQFFFAALSSGTYGHCWETQHHLLDL